MLWSDTIERGLTEARKEKNVLLLHHIFSYAHKRDNAEEQQARTAREEGGAWHSMPCLLPQCVSQSQGQSALVSSSNECVTAAVNNVVEPLLAVTIAGNGFDL